MSSTYADDTLSSGEEKKSEDYSVNCDGGRKEFTLDDGVNGAMAVGDSS